MPDLGNRANVMGPQPIAQRLPVAPDMLEAAHRIMKLLAQGDAAGLEAIAVEKARGDVAALARSARPGAYDKDEIIGHARMSRQYYLKARLSGPVVEPLTFQMRLGEQEGRWLIFEMKNLSGRRSAWTK